MLLSSARTPLGGEEWRPRNIRIPGGLRTGYRRSLHRTSLSRGTPAFEMYDLKLLAELPVGSDLTSHLQ